MRNRYIDVKYLIRTLIFASLTAAVILVSTYVDGVYNTVTSVPIFALCGIGIFLTFRNLREAIPRSTVEMCFSAVFRCIAIGINFVFGPIIRLGKRLGLFSNTNKRGRDESSFIFAQQTQKIPRALRRMPKWKDLTTNRQRIRFMFMSYLNTRIKKGYHFRRTLTPHELFGELRSGLDDDTLPPVTMLFDVYDIARYDDIDKDTIPNETVYSLRDRL